MATTAATAINAESMNKAKIKADTSASSTLEAGSEDSPKKLRLNANASGNAATSTMNDGDDASATMQADADVDDDEISTESDDTTRVLGTATEMGREADIERDDDESLQAGNELTPGSDNPVDGTASGNVNGSANVTAQTGGTDGLDGAPDASNTLSAESNATTGSGVSVEGDADGAMTATSEMESDDDAMTATASSDMDTDADDATERAKEYADKLREESREQSASVTAKANAEGKGQMKVKSKDDITFGRVISQLRSPAKDLPELANLGEETEIETIELSEIKAEGTADMTAFEAAIAENEANIAEFRQQLSEKLNLDPRLMSELEDEELTTDAVVAAFVQEEGELILVIDDRDEIEN
jgi:hypothetical protein